MKIAFVANTSWNIYNFRKGLVFHFLENGHQVVVFTPRDQYSDEIEKWGVRFIEIKLDQTGTNPIKDLNYLFQLIRLFRKEKPQVALCFTIKSNIYASIAGKWVGTSTICNVSGLGTVFLVKGWLGTVAINLYRFAFRHSSFVFFQNEDDQKLFVSYISISEEKMGILPGSGIDLAYFTYEEPVISKPLKVLMIARIIEEKGVREYVEAARQLKASGKEVVFSLIGSHDEGHARSINRLELDQWVSDGLVDYHKHSNEIKNHLLASEVVVLPSYREGTPRTLLEGAALGRALLASDAPGCREVVRDGYNGFLFRVKDAKSLASKVELYLSLSEDERLKLSMNSRKLVEETFDEKFVIQQYNRIISQIVDK